MSDLQLRFETANAVMEEAALLARQLFARRDSVVVEQKSANDFVSDADRQVEQLIRDRLKDVFPDDAILGEEMGGEVGDSFWSIDPIDGTTNFLRGLPLWGISIGYVENGLAVVGTIALPMLGLTLSAAIGCGVWRNGMPYRRQVPFSEVRLLALGESNKWAAAEVAMLDGYLRDEGWAVARYRCATVGLSFAALGFTDGYVEKNTSIWDIAAGVVIGSEAGLVVKYRGSYEAGGMHVATAIPEVQQIIEPFFIL
ncbi:MULTISPECIES: inositol monophosphatase family protein [Dickeya]|uniref:Inositol monophosphatase family protein n=1 Tax=Dickeya oryzae TaxID=1240404 RepID=A0AB39IGC7_9GAMM|nr:MULTISPECIES: inositol monophosphatase family protein [Dickeya]PXW43335.1 myo-inositol-1(or 4)-monophosphatase [Erwinia sp. AG740]AUQ25544.1 myo-inositol-1-monophosphatase [Dickeya zeae]MBP2847727.1 myo-inositol-1-monophosphatase [Dickeya oryzae]MBP2850114.1 myo-inositol-1-monophosphatase [Dickeya oryzae]MBP2858065.1 myo-inositol-1-monophosphatase [Dickeya oryzae]